MGQANAKYIHEYLEKVEDHLLEKNYNEADSEFEKLGNSVKHHAVKGDIVKNIYRDTVIWLKKMDEIELFINKASDNKELYEANGNYGVSTKNCQGRNCEYFHNSSITSGLPKTLPFSSEFVDYVNARMKNTLDRLNSLNTSLNEIAEEEKEKARLARIEEREKRELEAKIKREKEAKERERKEREKQQAIDAEVSRISKIIKEQGYADFSNMSVVTMIYKTQKEGGLEKYINKVMGCHKLNTSSCERWYPKIKAIQVLDEGVLYSFSEYGGGEYVSFIIYADKEPGKIYQEGQSFPNGFHVFDGMISYTTVAGVKKTVPHFKVVNLN
ncbi:MAG TPA: hypothetical protein ENJ28_01960 [Gammaproteobacteria bacterium]|nr:hypothetical protein [Gammaproteobacteria bacterium]